MATWCFEPGHTAAMFRASGPHPRTLVHPFSVLLFTPHQMFLSKITDDDTHAHATWALHDYVKTPIVNFDGYGHISHDYVKVDGQWKIIRGRTTRMAVDEVWLGARNASLVSEAR